MIEGISRYSCTLIQGDSRYITCDGVGPDPQTGKYAGWITFWKDSRPHIAPLISSEYYYSSAKEAKEAMEQKVKEVREMGELVYHDNPPKRAVVVPFSMIKHPNADKLSVVNIGNTTSYVARTEDWKEVTKAVYIPEGSTVDTTRPEFAWLAHLGEKVIVTPKNQRGIMSSCLMVRVPDNTPLGADWTNVLGIILPSQKGKE